MSLAKQYDEEILKKLRKTELEIFKDFIAVCNKYDLKYFLAWGTAIGAVRHKGFIPWDDDLDIGMLRNDYEKFVDVMEKELGEKYILATPKNVKGYASTVIKLEKKGTKFVPEFAKKMKCDLCIHIDIFVYDYLDDDEKKADKTIFKTRLISRIFFLIGSPDPIIPYRGMKKRIAQLVCKLAHIILQPMPKKWLYDKYQKLSKQAPENSKYISTYMSIWPKKNKFTIDDLLPLRDIDFEGITVKVPQDIDKILRKTYGDYMIMPPVSERVNHCAYMIDFGDEKVNE